MAAHVPANKPCSFAKSCMEARLEKDMVINTFKIKIMLAEMGMTRAELGVRCGISRQSISTILTRGTCEPKTAGKLAKGLGVQVQEICKEATP